MPPASDAGSRGAGTAAFPKTRRLLKRRDFLRTVKRGARYSNRHFVLSVFRRDDDGPSRVGLTAMKKVGCAVVRNRLRRRAREVFRRHAAELKPGRDLAVLFLPAAAKCEMSSFREAFLQLLDRAALWEGSAGGERGEC